MQRRTDPNSNSLAGSTSILSEDKRRDRQGLSLHIRYTLSTTYCKYLLCNLSSGGGGSRSSDRGQSRRDAYDRGGARPLTGGNYETYGLSSSFLRNLGIEGPLCNRIFVANVSLLLLLLLLFTFSFHTQCNRVNCTTSSQWQVGLLGWMCRYARVCVCVCVCD